MNGCVERLFLPAIPSDVEEVVLIALSKDPQRRFGSVRAFAVALEQASQPTTRALSREGIQVFFSYARRDQNLRDQLENHLSNLKYRGLITTWHAREISAGEETIQQIDSGPRVLTERKTTLRNLLFCWDLWTF